MLNAADQNLVRLENFTKAADNVKIATENLKKSENYAIIIIQS